MNSTIAVPRFLVLFLKGFELKTQDRHTHAQDKGQKADDDISGDGTAAKNTRRCFIFCIVSGNQFFRNSRHGKGHAHNHSKTGRRGQRQKAVSPLTLLPLDLCHSLLDGSHPFFMTSHL